MIGTHNTLTYLDPVKWWYKPFKFLWRCQEITIQEQLNSGARYFDIRVRFNKDGDLVYCHGIVDLDEKVDIMGLLDLFVCYNCKCRIILERGKNLGLFDKIPREYLGIIIDEVIIKKEWIVLYRNEEIEYTIKDYCYIPFNSRRGFFWNLLHMRFSTIKGWAKKHNPIHYKNKVEDPKILHFLDYLKLPSKIV